MKINRTGVSRIVLEFKNFVIKIPNFTYSWYHFIWGICSNIEENQCWKWNSGKYEKGKSHLLCPVKWCSYGGWILIMQKANIKRHEIEVRNLPLSTIPPEEETIIRYKEWIEAGFGGDDKCDNYGYIEDRLVKIDYSRDYNKII